MEVNSGTGDAGTTYNRQREKGIERRHLPKGPSKEGKKRKEIKLEERIEGEGSTNKANPVPAKTQCHGANWHIAAAGAGYITTCGRRGPRTR